MRGTTSAAKAAGRAGNFNPRAPCGARRRCLSLRPPQRHFNPRAPCGARLGRFRVLLVKAAISIHVPLAGHDRQPVRRHERWERISIHVPLAGHDATRQPRRPTERHFNPRAPCGARQVEIDEYAAQFQFQSTCPLRGTTQDAQRRERDHEISIHVPLAGHDYGCDDGVVVALIISIHVPLAGHDQFSTYSGFVYLVFQSTCPLRGTTSHKRSTTDWCTFQSTCPLRGTTSRCCVDCQQRGFQSTCPLRGTTVPARRGGCSRLCISIHVPLAGHDQLLVETLMPPITISIHVPLAGHDRPALRKA